MYVEQNLLYYLALFLFYAVPTPDVKFDLTSSDTTPPAGETVTLNCRITLLGGVTDSDAVVNSTWTMDGAVFSGVSGRVTLTPQTRVNSTLFITQLVFSPLSSSMDNGTYTCVVTVTPLQTEFVIGAMGLGSITLSVRGLLVIFPPNFGRYGIEMNSQFGGCLCASYKMRWKFLQDIHDQRPQT